MSRIALLILLSLLLPPILSASEVFRFDAPQKSDLTGVAGTPDGSVYVCGILEKPAQLPGPLRRFHAGGLGYHGFITKLKADGTPAFSAAFGGAYTLPGYIAVAPNGDVIVAGLTTDANFPVRKAVQASLDGEYDVFIIRFDSELRQIRFATFLGGKSYDSTAALALDRHGNAYVAINSRDGLLQTNVFDFGRRSADPATVIVKLSPDGEFIQASRLNSFTTSGVLAMAVDSEERIHIAGTTYGAVIPVVNSTQQFPIGFGNDAFLSKFTSDGRELVFSTYLGGACQDSARAIAIKPNGEILVGGETCSEIFPSVVDEGSINTYLAPSRGFVARYSSAGNLLETQMIDHSGNDAVTALALDSSGNAIVGGNIGSIYNYPNNSSIPFVASVVEGEPIISHSIAKPCSTRASLIAMSASGSDIVFVGQELPQTPPGDRRSFVSKVTIPSRKATPAVALLNPSANSIYAPGRPILLSAAAYGGTGVVEAVKFFDGDTLIGTVTNTPFQMYWSNAFAGTHAFSAAADWDGEVVRSCVVPVTLGSPVNDRFEDRVQLRGERINVAGRMSGATSGAHEYPFQISVWWEWVAPRSGPFKIWLTDYAGYQIRIFTGDAPSDLQTVADSYSGSLILRAQKGVAYKIAISSYGTDNTPDFRLRIAPVQTPRNDERDEAQVLTGTQLSVKGTLRNASPDYQAGYFGNGVWYSWQAPTSGPFLAWADSDTQSLNVQVLTLNTAGNVITTGQPVYYSTNGQTFSAQAGETYFVHVSSYGPQSKFTLHLRPQPAPPNDEFENASDLFTSLPVKAGTVGATWNAGETTASFVPAVAWWKWTAPSSGVYRIQAPLAPLVLRNALPSGIGGSPARPGSGYVQVYTGDSLLSLASVLTAEADFGGKFRAEAGETYSIAINSGLSEFTLAIQPVPSPSNDFFADATLLVGTNVTATAPIRNSTLEPGEPVINSFPYSQSFGSVWYRWMAPEDGAYSFAVSGAANVVAYLGTKLGSLQPTMYVLNRSVIRASAGEIFSIAVYPPNYYTLNDLATLHIQRVTPPDNDDFANREVLSGLPVSFIPRTRNATLEADEPEARYNPRRIPSTVWYTWTAPVTGRFELVRDGFDTLAYAYRGSTLPSLESVGTEFDLLQGETVQISALLMGGQSAAATYTLSQVIPPSNDNFADRLSLTGIVVSVVGTTRNATREMFEDSSVGDSTVWYSWTASRSGRVLMEIAFPNSSTSLAVFTGDALPVLNPVAPNTQSRSAEVSVEAGETYQISVGEFNYGYGEFGLHIRYLDSPPNDALAQATPVKRQRARGTTAGASIEPDEPLGDLDAFASSVWWTWKAPRTAVYQVEARGAAEVAANVFSGSDFASLESVRMNEGIPARFAATKGQPYLIQLISPNGNAGSYEFEVVRVRPPANDDFTNRIVLQGNALHVRTDNRFASAEEGEPGASEDPPRRSLWWSWTAPSDGALFLKLADERQLTALFRGNDLASLENQNFTGSTDGAMATVAAGVEYQIVVDVPLSAALGQTAVEFALRFIAAPANDRFENRITLTGAAVRATGTVVGASGVGEDAPWEFPHTIWWRWVVPETGRYTMAVRASDAWPLLRIFRGDDLTTLEFLEAGSRNPSITQLNLPFTDGDVITLQVSADVISSRDTLELSIYQTQRPANDDFTNRFLLVNGHGVGPNEGASREEAEPHFTNDPLGASLWWRYTPPSNGWVVINARLTETNVSTLPSGIAPDVRVYEGSTLDGLTEIPSRRFIRPGPTTCLLQGGVEYAIEVSDQLHRLGDVEIALEYMPPPPNDNFADAFVLTGDGWTATGSNYWATAEPEEEGVFAGAANSIWWRWTAPASGRYELRTTSYQHYVLAYRGDTLTNLDLVAGTFGTIVFFGVEAGITYHFRFTAPLGMETVGNFHLRRAEPPLNDHFTNRTALVGSHFSVLASNYFATMELDEPSGGSFGKSVWWKWTAPATGPVTVSFATDYGNLFAAVYTGSTLESLAFVANYTSQPITFSAEAGREYVIEVNGYPAYETQFILSLDQAATSTSSPAKTSRVLKLPTRYDGSQLIETSTDLMNWQPFQTNAPGKTNIVITPNVNEPQRFFRVR